MAGKQRPTMGKRIREKNKREKKQAKLEEKARRKAEGGIVGDDIVDVASLIPDPDVYGQETVDVPEEEDEESEEKN
ncbi:MAG: hypothetical protein CMN76_11275 [Spirochaetaceae bacterium]|nr:hypothetical protein [Spirochaetaceae bacterium]|tara:strand:+ start:92671 stop:92898 length:228 start_codon:yes stop_codon:yes gene_type:complete